MGFEIGGPLGGFNPLGNMGGVSYGGGVMGSMMGAAAAVGVPGYSMAPLAASLIAPAVGFIRSTYWGSDGMQAAARISYANGDIQRGVAPGSFGGMALGGFPQMMGGGMMIPNFVAPMMAMWAAMNPAPVAAGGPAQTPPPQFADDPEPAKKSHRKEKADKDEDAAPAKAEAKAKADETKAAPWEEDVKKSFHVPGVRLAGTDEKEGKHRVRLEPEAGLSPKATQHALAKALTQLHRKGVDSVVVKDEEIKTGSLVTPKKAVAKKDAAAADKDKKADDKKSADAKDAKTEKKAAPKKVWVPNTGRVMKALLAAAAPAAAPKKEAAGDTPAPESEKDRAYAAALVEDLKSRARIASAEFTAGDAKKPHSARFVADKDDTPEATADWAYAWVAGSNNKMKRTLHDKPTTPAPVQIVLSVPADKVKAVQDAFAKKLAAEGLEYVGKVSCVVEGRV